jgi:F-type H+-transporting ATPase subunit b
MDNPLVQVDPGLYIWTILTFLVLVGLLAKFAWKPILAVLDERQRTIALAVDDARKTREELERVQQESARILAAARVEADALMARARADAGVFRQDLLDKAAAEAATLTKNAERQIQRETAKALEQIRHEAVDLSVAIASRLLKRTVSAADHEALLQDVVKDIGRPAN